MVFVIITPKFKHTPNMQHYLFKYLSVGKAIHVENINF
ncbi:hypothetical protein A33Q_2949 [Indibacter alkaliphilus LW1]|uniref:Uncharacterized protein n=1 Tax=Indibacter alkaliphilus (strain CCUG 57479 / KCTC 22604 / LW1) TaxID=1189612 RepID=S2D8R7_INDAL|nr:hypothetical protein A33Q_2949 [Indibacter alkaliphilus LW1]